MLFNIIHGNLKVLIEHQEIFFLFANPMDNGWVGFGFSLDERMGQDDLYFCTHHGDTSSFKSAVSPGSIVFFIK